MTMTTSNDAPGLQAVQDSAAAELAAARAEVVQAEAEAAEAMSLIETLEQSVRGGATTVEAGDLERGYSLKRLATLRKEAAEERARKARAAVVAQRRAAVLKDAEEQLGAVSMETLADLHNTAREALVALAEAALLRRQLITETARKLAELDARRGGRVHIPDAEVVTVGGVLYRHQDAPVAVLLPRLVVQASKEIIGAQPAGLPDLHTALYQFVAGSPTPLEQLAAERRAVGESA